MSEEYQWCTTVAYSTAVAIRTEDTSQHSLDRNWLLSPTELEQKIAAIRRQAMIDGICLGTTLIAIAYVAVRLL